MNRTYRDVLVILVVIGIVAFLGWLVLSPAIDAILREGGTHSI